MCWLDTWNLYPVLFFCPQTVVSTAELSKRQTQAYTIESYIIGRVFKFSSTIWRYQVYMCSPCLATAKNIISAHGTIPRIQVPQSVYTIITLGISSQIQIHKPCMITTSLDCATVIANTECRRRCLWLVRHLSPDQTWFPTSYHTYLQLPNMQNIRAQARSSLIATESKMRNGKSFRTSRKRIEHTHWFKGKSRHLWTHQQDCSSIPLNSTPKPFSSTTCSNQTIICSSRTYYTLGVFLPSSQIWQNQVSIWSCCLATAKDIISARERYTVHKRQVPQSVYTIIRLGISSRFQIHQL